MADIQITVTVPDDLIERLRAHDPDHIPDYLWEEAQDEVIDAIRSGFSPTDLL